MSRTIDKKRPLPSKETNLSNKRLPQKLSENQLADIERLRNRLAGRHARISGDFINVDNYKKIGNALWLLSILLRTCNWSNGVWLGKETSCANILGVTDRTIRLWLTKLKLVDVRVVKRYPESIRIQIPDNLLSKAMATGKNKAIERKDEDERSEILRSETGKNRVEISRQWSKLGDFCS